MKHPLRKHEASFNESLSANITLFRCCILIPTSLNFLDAERDLNAHPLAIQRRGPSLTTLQFDNSGYQINNEIQSGIIEISENNDSDDFTRIFKGTDNEFYFMIGE